MSKRLALRIAVLRRRRAWSSSPSSSSASGTCRCSPATSTWPRRNNNRTREFRVAAPRGKILDRNGNVLVDNRTSLALQVNPQKLPEDPAERNGPSWPSSARSPTCRCSRCAGRCTNSSKVAAGAPVTLRHDVDYDLVYYLQENQDRFPGVAGRSAVFVRRYPHGSLRRPCARQRRRGHRRRARRTALPRPGAGRRGRQGRRRGHLRPLPARDPGADPDPGQRARPADPGRAAGLKQPPVPGDSLKLSLDSEVQAAGKAALAARGLPGAFVTMNVHNGQILGLGSFPTYDPTVFTKPMTQSQVNALYRDPVGRRSPTAPPRASTRRARPSS